MRATVWQMREIARRVITADRRRWMWRIIMTLVVFSLINMLSQNAMKAVFSATGANDVEMYAQRVKQMKSEGSTPAPLDGRSALHVVGATALMYLVVIIISGAGQVAVSRVSLRAVRDSDAGWAKDMFAGFKDPLGMLSLGVLLVLAIVLGLLLFVFPGLVAIYGLGQSWLLKAVHPEWSAARCMSVSWKLMKGRRFSLFLLDLSFLPLLLAGILFAVLATFVALLVLRSGVPLFGELMVLATLVATMAFGMYLSAYWYAARAVFYSLLEE